MTSINELINTTPEAYLSITDALINIFLGIVVSLILKFVYDKFESSYNYNPSFSSNFITLTLITIFIISVIKSSLALSLGLVGALSIVRFRTAIKEPSELIYLFFCIAIGLGFGANLPLFTLTVSFSIIFTIIIKNNLFSKRRQDPKNMFAELELMNSSESELSIMMNEIKRFAQYVLLIRQDLSQDKNLVSLKVRFSSTEDIDKLQSSKWFKEKVISFSFYESQGLI